MRESWQSYELDLINYQNKCKIIRGWDDLFNKVKEHINSVAAMKLSPYYKVSLRTYELGKKSFYYCMWINEFIRVLPTDNNFRSSQWCYFYIKEVIEVGHA